MKRHVHTPTRTVTVEDGVVRDLDGNTLGDMRRYVSADRRGWWHRPTGISQWSGPYERQTDTLTSLLTDPECPPGGPNLFDKPGRTR